MLLYKNLSKLRIFIFRLKKEDIINRLQVFIFCLLQIISTWLGRAKNKNIWLIGENAGDCLEDNGYYFYIYCRKNHPKHPVFFIIKDTSPFFKKLNDDSHVVRYGSFQHITLFFSASTFFYTHNFKDILYKKLFTVFHRGQKLVYLHHGVLGFKKFDDLYYKNRNAMDIFIVGSALEKKILTEQVGVEENKLKVTGYARYDYLKDNANSNIVVYMPTHRSLSSININESSFFLNIQSMLVNPDLLHFLETHNIQFYFYLHQAMFSFIDEFSCTHPNIKVIKYGEFTPLELINNCRLMITDYSSVSWDFFYLGKPIIFYRFDIDDYLSSRGSYIDLHENLIGDVVKTDKQVINLLRHYYVNDFNEKECYKEYRKKIMAHIDQDNSRRIYFAACEFNSISR